MNILANVSIVGNGRIFGKIYAFFRSPGIVGLRRLALLANASFVRSVRRIPIVPTTGSSIDCQFDATDAAILLDFIVSSVESKRSSLDSCRCHISSRRRRRRRALWRLFKLFGKFENRRRRLFLCSQVRKLQLKNIKMNHSNGNLNRFSAAGFHLPKDDRKPIIMIGPGTGIAPYRSFWQRWTYLKNENPEIEVNKVRRAAFLPRL